MTGETARKMRAEMKHVLQNTPVIGEHMVKMIRQVEETLKNLFLPGALFEDLGFTYVGPIDGHRLDYLLRSLENVKALTGPVLLHVVTKKGKGYPYAEEEPERFHGTPPFSLPTGQAEGGKKHLPTFTHVFGQSLLEFARDDRRIVAITAAMSMGTGLQMFAHEFPERFLTLVSPSNMA